MRVSSSHRILKAVLSLAIGCLVSLIVSRHELGSDDRVDTSRQLRIHHHIKTRRNHIASARQQPRISAPTRRSPNELSQSGNDDAEDVTSFWWNDLDYDRNIPCGKYKCYFRSASDPDRGYLLERRGPVSRLAPKAYQLAKRLESEHNITHLYAGPPFETTTPESFAEHAARNVAEYDGSNDLWGKRFAGAGGLMVQPSRNAPEGAMTYKCIGKRRKSYLNKLVENGHEGYEKRLLEGLAKTIALVDSTPTLIYDFQFMVDLDGRIYEIDLDRAVKPGKRWKTNGCHGQCPAQLEIRKCMEDAMAFVKKSMH